MSIEREQKVFDRELEAMIEDHAGEFVIIHGGKIIDFFPTYDAAYRFALQEFGPEETFLVSEVKHRGVEATSISWDLGVMFSA